MSWDVSIHKFPRLYRSVADIPRDEVPLSLGSRAFVHELVRMEFPGTDWSDPAWGQWSSADGSIDFNLGSDDPATGLMLHVRANTNVIAAIVRLCLQNGWQGIDCSSGEFLEQSEDPARGLVSWTAYRDQVIRGQSNDA